MTSYATSSPHPNFSRYEYPTSSVTILRFASGAVGKVASIVDSHQPYYLRVHLVGSEGTILDGKLWSKRIAGLDPDRWTELGVQLESLNVRRRAVPPAVPGVRRRARAATARWR